ncbi:MAG: hypothetical protein ACI9Z3_000618 [Roseivirga sp.]|jgi:hypothetical protein
MNARKTDQRLLDTKNIKTANVENEEKSVPSPTAIEDGIEELSGHDMSDVRVHYNSSKPAQLNNEGFNQGKQISLSDPNEKHLPHEAWHVVQQESRKKK